MIRILPNRPLTRAEITARYRAAHPDRIREYKASDASKASGRRYRATHPTDYGERSRHYRARLRPIVYLWVAADGTPDYVGRGTTHRPPAHRRKPWWTPDHILVSMTCETEWQAMEYEGRWGARHQPRHNHDGYRHAGKLQHRSAIAIGDPVT